MIDVRHVRATGIGSYTRTLLRELSAAPPHLLAGVVLLGPSRHLDGLVDRASLRVLDSEPTDAPMYSLGEVRQINAAIKAAHPRAFWTMHYPLPTSRRALLFATVHDLTHLRPNSLGGPGRPQRAYAYARLKHTSRKAEALFCVSQTTADSVRGFAPGSRVVHAPYSHDDSWLARSGDDECARTGGLVFIGSTRPHKNLERLLRAFGGSTRLGDIRLQVLLNDHPDPGQWALRRGVPARYLERVDFVSDLSAAELAQIYRNAMMVVMPSLNEGVGLPALEAMSVGTPVASARAGSLPEVCGTAAAYFDPYSVDSMRDTLERLAADPELRSRLGRSGHGQVSARKANIDNLLPLRYIRRRIGMDADDPR